MITLASASGNVFAYVWADEVPAGFDGGAWARKLCPRGDGLGVDGFFLLERPVQDRPWIMTHWDPDGSRSFCSNGTRAAAALLTLVVETTFEAVVSSESVQLRVADGRAALRLPEGEGYGLADATLDLPFPHAYGWTGTPHLAIEVPDVDAVDLRTFGPPLRHHPALPHGANVSILQVTAPGHARIRTWERGVEDETLCCGQGCAVAAAWLAARTGIREWHFAPRGRDAVVVCLEPGLDGRWSNLWLEGPVRLLARLTPGPGLELG